MTDRQMDKWTEFPLIDSTPERGRVKIHHWIFGESEVKINGKVLGSQCGNKVSFLECIILPLKEDLNLIVINIYLLQNIRLCDNMSHHVCHTSIIVNNIHTVNDQSSNH